MATVQQHYDRHLASIYGWMLGDPAAAARAAREDIDRLGLNVSTGHAVDLGAGLGFHAIALARSGMEVLAVDTSGDLLAELRDRAGALPVRTVQADLTMFGDHLTGPIDAAVCMGDTLTHMTDSATVETLVADVTAALTPGGVFAATFRDYTVALEGDDRFIPVRSDADRSLTCFLEYHPDVVTVHDIVHELTPDGWDMTVSSYPKVRLDPAWVLSVFDAAGLNAHRDDESRGMVRVTGHKPDGGEAQPARSDSR